MMPHGSLLCHVQDTAVHRTLLLHANAEVELGVGDSDLDPLDPRFLARIHDPHQR